jgi:hypothetical protein
MQKQQQQQQQQARTQGRQGSLKKRKICHNVNLYFCEEAIFSVLVLSPGNLVEFVYF